MGIQERSGTLHQARCGPATFLIFAQISREVFFFQIQSPNIQIVLSQ